MKIYEGVIEDDAVGYGLVKVRIFGIHTHDKTILPTTDLQDAQIMYPAESNIDEMSYFRTIKNGTRVIITFKDKSEQFPIVLGSLVYTVEEQPDFDIGFSDPNSISPDVDYLGESTISRLARTEKISETISQIKTDDQITGITCIDETIDQPDNPYAAVYPNNRVLQTQAHVIEIDDSTGAERINVYHKSGTFTEVHPDGTETKKVKAEKFLSVAGDNNIIVEGNTNIKSTGNVNIESTQINLNGSVTSSVGYTELLLAFNALKAELNALVIAHNTSDYSSGTASVPGVPPVADMSASEIPTVKLP